MKKSLFFSCFCVFINIIAAQKNTTFWHINNQYLPYYDEVLEESILKKINAKNNCLTLKPKAKNTKKYTFELQAYWNIVDLSSRSNLTIGKSGYAMKTIDPKAGWLIHFEDSTNYKWLKIQYSNSINAFDFLLIANEKDTLTNLKSEKNTRIFELKTNLQKLKLQIKKTNPEQNHLEISEIYLSNNDSNCIYKSTLIENLNLNELINKKAGSYLDHKNELFLIDFSLNQLKDTAAYKEQMNTLLDELPKAILISQEEKYLTNGLLSEVAEKKRIIDSALASKYNHITWYDFYTAAGGKYALFFWQKNNWADSNKLNAFGEQKKAEMISNILMEDQKANPILIDSINIIEAKNWEKNKHQLYQKKIIQAKKDSLLIAKKKIALKNKKGSKSKHFNSNKKKK